MEEIKKKRGRPRKNPLPDEIQNLVNEVQSKAEEQVVIEEPVEQESQITSEWDVPIEQPIEFFDASLSYELTGYKPITSTKGLDFDPSWFTQARDTYNRTGLYTSLKFKSKPYNDFWTKEYIKCRDGLTVNGYRITGDHYYFLNYYQLMNLKSVQKAGTGRLYDFPDFYVAQYQWFHYLDLCKRLMKDACLMKARGVGQIN